MDETGWSPGSGADCMITGNRSANGDNLPINFDKRFGQLNAPSGITTDVHNVRLVSGRRFWSARGGKGGQPAALFVWQFRRAASGQPFPIAQMGAKNAGSSHFLVTIFEDLL